MNKEEENYFASGKIQSLKLKISYKTGLRPCEIHRLKTADFDPSTRKLYPHTAKNGSPRTIPLLLILLLIIIIAIKVQEIKNR